MRCNARDILSITQRRDSAEDDRSRSPWPYKLCSLGYAGTGVGSVSLSLSPHAPCSALSALCFATLLRKFQRRMDDGWSDVCGKVRLLQSKKVPSRFRAGMPASLSKKRAVNYKLWPPLLLFLPVVPVAAIGPVVSSGGTQQAPASSRGGLLYLPMTSFRCSSFLFLGGLDRLAG